MDLGNLPSYVLPAAAYVGGLIATIATFRAQLKMAEERRDEDIAAAEHRRREDQEAAQRSQEAFANAAQERHNELMRSQNHQQETLGKLWGAMDEVRGRLSTTKTELDSFQKLEDERHSRNDKQLSEMQRDMKIGDDELKGEIKQVGRSLQEFKDRVCKIA